MPLVVSSLMGDESDVFDWILSLNPGNTQDLTTLLQMLREHYCGSLTFREQRNTIENLHEQFHEYLSPYGKNRNEFVVHTDNNPLTYIFSNANLDAAGQRWVAHLASYNFALEYQKGKDNTVADFLSHMDDSLPEGKVQDYLSKIPYPGVKVVLNNAIMPLVDRAEQGVWPNPGCQKACQGETLDARPVRLATTNVIDWKFEQKEDPVLYQVVKHQKSSCEAFKEALLKVTDQKATTAYAKLKEQLIMKNGLLYRQSKQGPVEEIIFQFVVPQIHRSAALDGCHH